MPLKHNKNRYFCINSKFPMDLWVGILAEALLPHFMAWASGPTTEDYWQLKTFVSCGRNVMFSKKLVSRADETPTFGSGFSCHELWRQKNISKTQGFSMFFLAPRNVTDNIGLKESPENEKSLLFLIKRLLFNQKSRKSNAFHYFLERRQRAESSLIS